ncbi:lysine-rich nucleolar protein 1 [Protobothrops mucrosquamatus]|uniref:lysine-rich nucleolar protein 1 n=1 Tax=Protobothrops mucrosquamatus TaxID=103944 RepID=UPI0010FB65EC|nr:lysine-rich nucleolar protein 1 [Protobothrops mucrosquamatus]
MKNPEQTARKRNKAKDPNCGQVVIIESPRGRYSDIAKKAKRKKLKCLVKEIGSERPDPKKKQRDSESKKDVRASSPVVIESGSDSELLRDAKKRNKVFKKEKDQKPFCTQFQNSEGVDEGQPGIHVHLSKKCSKSIREVDRQDEESTTKRKKKKKEKRKDKPTGHFSHSRDSEVSVKQISGELKPSCQEMLSSQKKSRTLGQKVVGEKVKKKHLDYYRDDQENSNSISKKDVAQNRGTDMQRQEDLARRLEKDGEATKKKEKKLKKIGIVSLASLARIQENCCNILSEYSLKCSSKKGVGVCEAPKEVNKAAKKEAKRETGGGSHFAETGQDILAKEKTKKAKKHKVERDGVLRGDRDGFEGSQEQIKKKKKNKKIKNSHDSKKKKQEAEDEVKLVAFRQGNCDEVKIDKVRRQALQEEIDRESGKTKTAKEELDNRLGQWSTAAFEAPEQKTKFHRLLGGLKKGLAPAQRSPANANQSNMALDRPREQVLQQNLEAEFKKAVEFKHHRGIGLGFRSGAPSGLHIDKYASKSIKFEDLTCQEGKDKLPKQADYFF